MSLRLGQQPTWERTHSCPCRRPPPAPVLKRRNSDPGRYPDEPPLQVVESESLSLISESRWSLYKPSAHWNEVFEPGRDLQPEPEEPRAFSLRRMMGARPHGMLGVALVFSASYLLYALYVTITKVRFCKPGAP